MALNTTTAPNVELMSALSTLLEAGKYSDLTIKCGARKFAVHRALICSRSGFFDGACSNAFREAQSGIIDLSEDDEEAVEHMVNYFYHLDYLSPPKSKRRSRGYSTATNPMSPTSPTEFRPYDAVFPRKKLNLAFVEDPLLATAAANILTPTQPTADPFPDASQTTPAASVPSSAFHSRNISLASTISTASSMSRPLTPPNDGSPLDLRLKIPPSVDSAVGDLEADRLEETIDEVEPDTQHPYLVTHCKVYAIAEKYGIAGLKSLARAKFGSQMAVHFNSHEFADAIQDVYDTTVDGDRGLRDVVIQTFREHPELAHRKDVEYAVKDTPGLAWELFRVGWGLPIV
ncbi:hypothetical protein NA57DRAFT_51371 [Rhizodiscina lignyota]|uniref:BTB domain-containing protein n=1 Tax=Rhizodiscina lignyota TaxID=1504668 RepID=A0A9P4IUJ6_9PEZI|nr:hypothetical protein NA57DRAFT_51371 [Rhizodiscina lignyota]